MSNDIGNRISVIEPKTNKVITTMSQNFIGSTRGGLTGEFHPTELAIDSNTNLLYMTIADSNSVYVIDTKTKRIVGNFVVGSNPVDIAVNTVAHTIYVLSSGDGSIHVINGKRDLILREVARANQISHVASGLNVGIKPSHLAINSVTNRIYVIDSISNRVSVINGITDKIVDTFTLRTPPSGIAVNPNTNTIYLLNKDQNSLIVVNGDTDKIVANVSISRVLMQVQDLRYI